MPCQRKISGLSVPIVLPTTLDLRCLANKCIVTFISFLQYYHICTQCCSVVDTNWSAYLQYINIYSMLYSAISVYYYTPMLYGPDLYIEMKRTIIRAIIMLLLPRVPEMTYFLLHRSITKCWYHVWLHAKKCKNRV